MKIVGQDCRPAQLRLAGHIAAFVAKEGHGEWQSGSP